MRIVKSFIAIVVAGAALAGVADASSIYTQNNVANHQLSTQMTNVVVKNNEAVNYQLTK